MDGHRAGRHVLLVTPPASYRLQAYCDAATELGVRPFIASTARHSLTSNQFAGINVDLASLEQAVATIRSATRDIDVQAVLATDDITVELASELAAALGLAHNPASASRACRRKDLSRQLLANAGLRVPGFKSIDLTQSLPPQLAEMNYPCVVKPLAMSGSRGVIRADDESQLVAACERIAPIIAGQNDRAEGSKVLVEDYLPGVEIAIEGLLKDGEFTVLAVFDKPEPLVGPFFEETYYVTPSRLPDDIQTAAAMEVCLACAALGLIQGPVHAELRVFDQRIRILEVAARTIGGDCARLLRFGTGHTLESIVLANALNIELDRQPASDSAGVMMIPTPGRGCLRRVEGILAAMDVPFVEDVTITLREGYELVPAPEGSSYLGFIFARAPSALQVETALRQAFACLNIVIAPLFPVSVIDL